MTALLTSVVHAPGCWSIAGAPLRPQLWTTHNAPKQTPTIYGTDMDNPCLRVRDYQCDNVLPMGDQGDFGERLAALLAARDLSQLEFAARVGVTPAAMSRYINGKREPRLVTAVRMAQELGVHVDQLVSAEAPLVTALRLVARTTLTEEQKAAFRAAVDQDGEA
ncbi:MAG: helix-turn-helix transcriptional regulator [Bifidobacteriaceae bacterium]|jgi:transcriptional regulator with XRE-family HTH domain|nr:helix-turn-helix transcriptional regulator [Bifidobacteriaceae bacterium]